MFFRLGHAKGHKFAELELQRKVRKTEDGYSSGKKKNKKTPQQRKPKDRIKSSFLLTALKVSSHGKAHNHLFCTDALEIR